MSQSWRVPLFLKAGNAQPVRQVLQGSAQVDLPGCGAVIVNGGHELVFSKPLAKEGRLGPFRWLSIFLGIAGTYRKNDSVDVVYDVGGRRTVAAALPIIPPS